MKGESLDGPLSHTACNSPEACVYLPWRRAKNKRNNGVTSNFYILEGAQYMYFSAIGMNASDNRSKKFQRMLAHVSARTMRVRLVFSMVNFVFPS